MIDFSPATREWFKSAFADATTIQRDGWPWINSGDHVLLIAPTGSGKTLAAFLSALDRCQETAPEQPGYRVLYVSPLKALAHDVERNLRAPLAGIANAARALEQDAHQPRVDIRTGDTPQTERTRMLKRPGDILVTTPESLYLMLGSRMRENLRHIETVIVDEVHALAPTKRGAHLALSLERLSRLCEQEPQRIGLSATARPPELVASFLGGDRAVEIVDRSAKPLMELQVCVPVADMENPPEPDVDTDEIPPGGRSLLALAAEEEGSERRPGIWPSLLAALMDRIDTSASTIVFVNSRGLCERLAQRLNDMHERRRREELSLEDDEPIPEPVLVRTHHGSMARDKRSEVEELLKEGRIKAIIATSSLELGIDMATVDHVVMIESPGSVARGLQRIGRAGHGVGQTSQGTIMPKHRGDLLEAAVVAHEMRAGAIESLSIPERPLDVLAQQIVAMVAVEDLSVAEVARSVRRAQHFRELGDELLNETLDMLSGRYPSADFSELRPRLVWDRESDRLRARRGANMLALTSGGTIPDRGLFAVMVAPDGPRVGELDEEMVFETRPGQVVTLGATSWRVAEIQHDRVLVEPAGGEPGRLPFWRGDGPGRPIELGRAIGSFLRRIEELDRPAAQQMLETELGLDQNAAQNLIAYLDDQNTGAGLSPSDRRLVVERHRDELGDWRIVILSPFGSRVHAPWGLAIENRLRHERALDLQVIWNDDGIVIRFADCDELPETALLLPDPEELEELVVEQLGNSSLFASLFRENAARALLLPRGRPGKRSALWAQRLRAKSLLAVASEYPSFPIVLETYRSAMRDVFDLGTLTELLRDLRRGRIELAEVELDRPSAFARSLTFAFTAAFLYEGDAPAAEARAQALALDRDLLRELLGSEDVRSLLDREAVAEVEMELLGQAENHQARDADELHDLLRRRLTLRRDELSPCCAQGVLADQLTTTLLEEKRVIEIRVAGESRLIAIENAALLRDAVGAALPSGLPARLLEEVSEPILKLLLAQAKASLPFSARAVATRFGIALSTATRILDAAVQSGKLLRGEFLPGGRETEYSDPDVLRRLKSRSLVRLRREIEPVEQAALGRFLLDWHGLDQPSRDLEGTLRRLEGLVFLPERVGIRDTPGAHRRLSSTRLGWFLREWCFCLDRGIAWQRTRAASTHLSTRTSGFAGRQAYRSGGSR